MDRGDRAVANADCLVDDLDHRREAIGRAGGGGDDLVPRGVIFALVDAINDVRRRPVLDRGGDDNLLHPRIEIGLKCRLFLEGAGAVDHHIDAA